MHESYIMQFKNNKKKEDKMGLILKDVSKTFVGKKVVDNISIELEKPGVFGLLGTNGARKNYDYSYVTGNIKKR